MLRFQIFCFSSLTPDTLRPGAWNLIFCNAPLLQQTAAFLVSADVGDGKIGKGEIACYICFQTMVYKEAKIDAEGCYSELVAESCPLVRPGIAQRLYNQPEQASPDS